MYWLRNTSPGVIAVPYLRDSSNGVLSWGPAGSHLQWACVAEAVLRDAHVEQHLVHRTLVPDPAYDAERSERELGVVLAQYAAVFGDVSGRPAAAGVPAEVAAAEAAEAARVAAEAAAAEEAARVAAEMAARVAAETATIVSEPTPEAPASDALSPATEPEPVVSEETPAEPSAEAPVEAPVEEKPVARKKR